MTETHFTLAGRNDEPVSFDELGRGPQLLAALHEITACEPPFVMGVYGDWGDGKTSFMLTLQALLGKATCGDYSKDESTMKVPSEERLAPVAQLRIQKNLKCDDVLTVWFNPWRHQFEDEPILPLLDAIRLQQASRWDKVKTKLKRVVENPKFRIIGKAALGVAKMAGPGWLGAMTDELAYQTRQIMDSFADFREEFERCMRELTANNGKRIVIFVDDLDRCEAEHSVRILEALKLHLLNRHCVFVLGCADRRIRRALRKTLNLSETDANEYLDKIVQVPLRLPRPRNNDLRRLLTSVRCEELAGDKACFALLLAFAGAHRNPRLLKRFLHWYETESLTIGFVPGLADGEVKQLLDNKPLFLKAKMLQYLRPDQFLEPEDYEKYDGGKREDAAERAPSGPEKESPKKAGAEIETMDSYQRLLRTPPFIGEEISRDDDMRRGLLLLLWLTTKESEARQSAHERRAAAVHEARNESFRIIEAEVRKIVDRKSGSLTASDWLSVHRLDLSDRPLTDLSGIVLLKSLRDLSVLRTNVTDISPLTTLSELEVLGLVGTPVKDIAPLRKLANLRLLSLAETQVTDIEPLSALTRLESLFLAKSLITDIGPLASLENLEVLGLEETQITDLAPLSSLPKLRELHLVGTEITDVSPLGKLTNLRQLDLHGTEVSDISPLSTLGELRVLRLSGSPVTDVTPLQSLVHLHELHLDETPITDVTPLRALRRLRTLSVNDTQLDDVAPLGGLKSLRDLDLTGTRVDDVSMLDFVEKLTLPSGTCRRKPRPQ